MITQEQFNTIYLGLQAQDWQRSYDTTIDQCLYRHPTLPLKCAIGQLIPDDVYTPEMDDDTTGIGIYSLGDFQNLGLFKDMTSGEFDELQSMHDAAHEPARMKSRFEDFANNHDLAIP